MKILVIDQFSGITPYELQQRPRMFDELVAEELAKPRHIHPAQVLEVEPDNFQPEWATTVIRADDSGMAVVWMTRWDSSG